MINKIERYWPKTCEVVSEKRDNFESCITMAHALPAAIMFFITIGFVTLFFIPATKFPRKNKLINFYWSGFWIYLAMIAALSGAANTLLLLKLDVMNFSDAVLFGISASFVFFVMFAWVRLSGSAIIAGVKRLRRKYARA